MAPRHAGPVKQPRLHLCRRNKADSRFSMRNRSIHAQSSRTKILNRDISLRELEKAESRGMDNKTFSRIYEHAEEGDHDSEDGHSFMIDNQNLSPKKEDLKYMEEVRVHYTGL